MENRENLSLTDNIQDVILKMAEGNMGAINVLMQILQSGENGFFRLLDLDDMNIRGTQIWVAYKDHCGEDFEVFVKAVKERDSAMVEKVNAYGSAGNHAHKAVTHGGSSKREMLSA